MTRSHPHRADALRGRAPASIPDRVPGQPRPHGLDPRDPLAGVDRLIVDGSNLLHALRRGVPHGPGPASEPAPAATLIGRLRAAIQPAIRIELIFDGPPERGLGSSRIAAGLTVRHSGRASADWLIDRLVSDAVGSGGTADEARSAGQAILVVTDDAELAETVRRRGGRSLNAAWLVRRLDRPRLSSPSAGAPRPPASPRAADQDENDRPGWRPGRGATRKRGNARRASPKRSQRG